MKFLKYFFLSVILLRFIADEAEKRIDIILNAYLNEIISKNLKDF